MCGDFNIIKSLEEKKGGIRMLKHETNLFEECAKDLGFVDINIINGICTWNNRLGGSYQVPKNLIDS